MVHNSPTTRALDHPIDLPHCPCSLLRMALASFPLSFVLGQKRKGNKQDWLGQFGHFVWEGSLKGNSWCLAFWNRVVIKEGIVSGSWGYGQPSLFLSLFFSFFHPLICTFTIQRSFMGNSVCCIPFLHMQKREFCFLHSFSSHAENSNKMAGLRNIMAVLFMKY